MDSKNDSLNGYIGPNCDPSGHFFKITNADENHKGYQYTDGLNILQEDFSIGGSCVPGGLYFTKIEHIYKFLFYGVYLRDISLPFDDPELKMVKDPAGGKWRANKIILGKKYELSKIETHEYLISKGAQIDHACASMIDIATKEDNFEMIKHLHEKYPKCINLEHMHYTMMRIAVKNRNLELASILIKEGLPKEKVDKIILKITIKKKDWDGVKLLITNETCLKDDEIRSILDGRNMDLIKIVVSSKLNFNAYIDYIFEYAIEEEILDLVKLCLEHGFKLGGYGEENAVRILAQKGNLEIFNFMIEKGANFKHNSYRLLTLAAQGGHLNLVKYLIEKGVSVQANDNDAIFKAVRGNHLEVVKFLYENGAKIRSRNDLLIITAAKRGYFDMVKFLVENGADPAARNNLPVQNTFASGHKKIGKYLLEIIYQSKMRSHVDTKKIKN